jgi:hypothetical protein
MKINHLIKESNTTLHERVAQKIPRGIQSHNEICKIGYKLAVQEVGIKEAQQLDAKFAIKLMSSYYQQHINEGLGSAIGYGAGKLAKGVGAVAGGVAGMWDAAKKGFAAGRSTVSGAADDAPATSGGTAPAASGGTANLPGGEVASNNLLSRAQQGTTQDPNAQQAAPAVDPAIDGIMQQVQGLDANQKQELLAKLQSGGEEPAAAPSAPPTSTPAAPAGQSMEIDPAKAAADKAAKNQADADQRNADIEKTKQANAQTAAADAALVAAVKAAKEKPGFQQTAQDKLTIQQGAAKGIHESKKKKKKKLAEFKSKFLGMVI